MHRFSLAAAIAASLAAPAFAADTPESTLDQVIVTGTRAKDRTVLDSPVPVDVLTADDLRAAGAINGELGQALAVLLPSFNFPRQSNSGGSDHVRAAQLRGMSPDQVLVLVNGKRRHTTALVNTDTKIGKGTTPVDFNSIPISAIKRIEVLRDGAGAQYGSDAIAGVINIILDDADHGGEVTANYGAYHTDFDPTGDTLTDGQGAFASAKFGTKLGDGGFARFGVELDRRAATHRAGYDELPPWENDSPENVALRGKRNYRAGDPETENYNAWINAEVPFSPAWTGYAFATLNARHSIGANYFRYPDSSANVPAIYPNGYRPDSLGSNRDLSATGGVRGRAGEWDVDASLTHGRNDFEYRLRNSLNVSLGAASPTRFKVGEYGNRQTLANLDFIRGIGNSFTLALGGEARRESFETQPGDPASYAVGPVIGAPTGAQAGGGLTPQDAADLARDVFGAYADFAGNLGAQVFVDVAARYEHYDDFGGELTGKASARWEFAPGYAFRGAVSNSFRAPSLSQVGFESTTTGYGADGVLTTGRLLSVNNPIARALGAKPLDAEKSTNVSFGFTAQVTDAFDVSLDLFRIDVDDRVTLSERITGDALEAFIEQRFGVAGVQSASFFTNAVDTRTRGAELVTNWRAPLAGGTFTATGAYSYADTKIRKVRPTPRELTELGADNVLFGVEERNTLTDAAPRQRAFVTTKWDGEDFSLLGRVTRQGSTTRVFNFGGGFEPRQTYAAKWQLDAEVERRLTPSLSLALGGYNLTDQYPDRSIPDISYAGNFPYDVISPIGLNGAYYYGRVRYRFD
ncbi:TonB-dependent receptor plug domain-containing protein [Tahibacter soli]|uniref:TonB-dependent receptor n=1 Tax=Tahibacter soli TaxID=2983605 RepID=A0A9X3YRH2_9GAMM|nr:TonB-dependent receptor [Tahibacter soli]MDC8015753.1 TonB-dependent receptor [Tahibacter soli]